jgi:hypothetical protein
MVELWSSILSKNSSLIIHSARRENISNVIVYSIDIAFKGGDWKCAIWSCCSYVDPWFNTECLNVLSKRSNMTLSSEDMDKDSGS